MGVTPGGPGGGGSGGNRRLAVPCRGRTSSQSSDDDAALRLIAVSRPESLAATTDDDTDVSRPPSPPRTTARLRKVASGRKPPAVAYSISLKKGRRSRMRYENDRILLSAIEEGDEADLPPGWDVGPASNGSRASHFAALMEDEDSLLRFMSTDADEADSSAISSSATNWCDFDEDGTFHPEAAYKRVRAELRHTFKKHLPQGMLEGLETSIRTHFCASPGLDLSLEGLSSFERLIGHAVAAYNALHSNSFDDATGGRVLRLTNPRKSTFEPVDPSLAAFLVARANKTRSGCSSSNATDNQASAAA